MSQNYYLGAMKQRNSYIGNRSPLSNNNKTVDGNSTPQRNDYINGIHLKKSKRIFPKEKKTSGTIQTVSKTIT